MQPRDTCYVADPGLTTLTYSGYKPHAYTWDDFPPLKDILDAVSFFLSTFPYRVFFGYKFSLTFRVAPNCLHFSMSRSTKLFQGVVLIAYSWTGIKVVMIMWVGILMMRKCMHWTRRLLLYHLDVNEISFWKRSPTKLLNVIGLFHLFFSFFLFCLCSDLESLFFSNL